MNPISIRYGESVTLPIDTGDITDVEASIYIGKPGQQYILSKTISLTDGVGVFIITEEETKLPLGIYYYQINTTDNTGYVQKFPEPEENCGDCQANFPEFIIYEALDEIEVS